MAATDTKPRGGKPDKIWRDAIQAALRQDPNKIKKLAEKLIAECEAGNMQAIKELGDRLDGKPTQQLDVGNADDTPFRTSLAVTFLDTIPEETPEPIPTEAL